MTTELDELLATLPINVHNALILNPKFKSLKSQIESKLALANDLESSSIHTDENGIKTMYAMCIYTPRNDLWIRDEYGNLLNLNKLEYEKQQAESQHTNLVKAIQDIRYLLLNKIRIFNLMEIAVYNGNIDDGRVLELREHYKELQNLLKESEK